jgi:outer membrane lipase/esterase
MLKELPLKHLQSVLSLAFVVICAPIVRAQSYSAMYVFGDSFCDTGNIFLATEGATPASPYFEGRFSNGPLWVDKLAGSLDLPIAPLLAGGTNYAFGGAKLLQIALIPSVPVQVEFYLWLHGGQADPNALYVIEGGINDVLFVNSGSPEQLGLDIANALFALELELRAAGAKHILLVNLPDIGLLPVDSSDAAFASAVSNSADLALRPLFETAKLTQGIEIGLLDMQAFSQAVQNDPAEYGFSSITTPCLSATNQVCANPSKDFFWDTVHPTATAHAWMGKFAEAQIQP